MKLSRNLIKLLYIWCNFISKKFMVTQSWHIWRWFRIWLNSYFLEMILIMVPLNLEFIDWWTLHHSIVISIIISMITLSVTLTVVYYPKLRSYLWKKWITFILAAIYTWGILYSITKIKWWILSQKGQLIKSHD